MVSTINSCDSVTNFNGFLPLSDSTNHADYMYCTSYNIGTPKSLKGIFLTHTNMHAQTHTHTHTHTHKHTHTNTHRGTIKLLYM